MSVSVYYNDNEPFVCAWLKNLIAAKLLPAGDVDERPIEAVSADDVRGYTQAHFFAGIGGWPYALQLAGWGDRPIWTGSCPCQPFSAAGKRAKQSDERHLWPHWYRLIREQSPPTIFGEQVDDAVAAGWIDDAFSDLESSAYACAAAILPACGVSAPHERQRIYFVADHIGGQQRDALSRREPRHQAMAGVVANDPSTTATGRNQDGRRLCWTEEVEGTRTPADCDEARRAGRQVEPRIRATEITLNRCAFVEAWQSWNGGFGGFGRVDDGIPQGVAKRIVGGFGNAIVPQVAAAFVSAYMECAP